MPSHQVWFYMISNWHLSSKLISSFCIYKMRIQEKLFTLLETPELYSQPNSSLSQLHKNAQRLIFQFKSRSYLPKKKFKSRSSVLFNQILKLMKLIRFANFSLLHYVIVESNRNGRKLQIHFGMIDWSYMFGILFNTIKTWDPIWNKVYILSLFMWSVSTHSPILFFLFFLISFWWILTLLFYFYFIKFCSSLDCQCHFSK